MLPLRRAGKVSLSIVCKVSTRTYIFAYIGVADEELRTQVLLLDDLVIRECDRAYASKHKVLSDFVGERLDRHEEDVGSTDSAVC